MDTGGEKKKRTPKKNMDGKGTGSHGKKTFRNGPVVKQEGMVSGFRKMAAAVTRPERWIDVDIIWTLGLLLYRLCTGWKETILTNTQFSSVQLHQIHYKSNGPTGYRTSHSAIYVQILMLKIQITK